MGWIALFGRESEFIEAYDLRIMVHMDTSSFTCSELGLLVNHA